MSEVIPFPSDALFTDLVTAVKMLEQCGGDLDEFCQNVRAAGVDLEDRKIVFKIELALNGHDDRTLISRWRKAIRIGMVVRLRFRQADAFKRLEEIDDYEGNKAKDNELTVANVIAYSKFVLGDFIAIQIAQGKNPAEDEMPIGDPEDSYDDDADLEDVMAGA